MSDMEKYDVIIIGGGPAGVSAGVYAGRKQLKTALITWEIGGQSTTSSGVENWIGDKMLTGLELAKKLEAHIKDQETVEIITPDKVSGVEKTDGGFTVTTEGGKAFETVSVIVCSGGRHRHLNVPGEEEFNGKGVAYCATCDAPFFRDKEVAVVGGGNSGLEAVVDLLPFAKKIFILARDKELKGDPITQKQIHDDEKVEVIFNADTTEIIGDKMVTAIKFNDLETKEEKELAVGGVFVEIGAVPNTGYLKDVVELNDFNQIKVDHQTFQTSVEGIFAAGEATDVLYSQNNIAAGDAVKATLSCYSYILDHKRKN